MKKFLLDICRIPLAFALAIAVLSCIAYRTEMKAVRRAFACPPNVLAAAVGDSRVETAFDPEEIPWLRNYGKAAMPIGVTAQKAKLIVECNPSLQLLVVDIWPKQFFSDLSKPFASNGLPAPKGLALIETMTREYMPPIGDGFEVRFKNDVLLPGLKRLLGLKKKAKNPIVGRFVKNRKFLKDHTTGKWRFGAPKTPESFPKTPADGEIVLDDLLAWLTSRNVKVVLTTTPILWYEKRYSPEAREYFDRRMREIAAKHGVRWFNWLDEYQDRMDYWADGCHLNDIGAKAFSNAIKNELAACLSGGDKRSLGVKP